jgi:hypothetical protein
MIDDSKQRLNARESLSANSPVKCDAKHSDVIHIIVSLLDVACLCRSETRVPAGQLAGDVGPCLARRRIAGHQLQNIALGRQWRSFTFSTRRFHSLADTFRALSIAKHILAGPLVRMRQLAS